MYRCFVCDGPAELNCACHTQIEAPTEVVWPFPANQPKLLGYKSSNKENKLNVASGEDVLLAEYV